MIVAVLVAAVTSASLCAVFARTRLGLLLLDRPNSRSLHQHPVPRVGGVGIYAGLIAGMAALTWMHDSDVEPVRWLILALLPLVTIGLLDDRYTLGAPVRFFVQAVTAVAVLYATGWVLNSVPLGTMSVPLTSLAWPITILAVLWVANLYNFMDGMDGFAALMTTLGFGALGVFALAAGHRDIALAAALPAAAAAGFMIFNIPPARLFMGDSGSVALGFLAAVIGLWGTHRGAWHVAVPVIVFSPFIVDATVTLAMRAWRREHVWKAHREHAYQRLVLRGIPHAKVLAIEAAFMICAVLLAVLALNYPVWGTSAAVAGVAVFYGVLLVVASRPAPGRNI
jgi:UDP-N-acetylmuramyl pentapeptide phosphotransferase/UDP-N-acetylglucosamine-1-phosphate transferase